jgi:nitrite reductase/ring-hydroxylating ferredoxin subunit
MWSKLFGAFGRKSVLIQGAAKLPEGQSRRVELGDPLAGGVELVLARVGGKLCAVDRLCPHEGGRISDGPLLGGKYLVCPLHNYKFDPTNGRAVGVACSDARTYKVEEHGADARVYV